MFVFFFSLWECRFRALPEFLVQDSIRGNVMSAQLSFWRRISQAKPESNFPSSAQQRGVCVCVYACSKTRWGPHPKVIHLEFKSKINVNCLGLEYFNINRLALILLSMIWTTWLDLAPNPVFPKNKTGVFFQHNCDTKCPVVWCNEKEKNFKET